MIAHSRFFSVMMVIALACGQPVYATNGVEHKQKTKRLALSVGRVADVAGKLLYMEATVASAMLGLTLFGLTRSAWYAYKTPLTPEQTAEAWLLAKSALGLGAAAVAEAYAGNLFCHIAKELKNKNSEVDAQQKATEPACAEKAVRKYISFAWKDTTFGEHWAFLAPLYALAAKQAWGVARLTKGCVQSYVNVAKALRAPAGT